MMQRGHRLIQMACFVAACLLLWPPPFWTSAPGFFVQISPFVALCAGIAARSIRIGAVIGLVVAIVGILRRRWFCKYVCPMGLLLEGAAKIGLKKNRWWIRWAPLGQYAALLTVAGSIVGYPFFLWMDPLALFGSAFSVRTAGSALYGILAGIGLVFLILLSLTSGAIWCARLCPLGGLLDLVSLLKSLFKSKATPSGGKQESTSETWYARAGRRSFLFVVIGAGLGWLSKRVGAARGESAPLRPPGAVPESEFAGRCLRCGNCLRVCPSRIIRQDLGQAGALGLLAPIVLYKDKYCLENCGACTQACPSGAIQSLTLNEKRRYAIGEALVDFEICALALGIMDCDACMRSCPFDAIGIHWDEVQYVSYPMVDRGKCNGCGACEIACPVQGDKAIRVWKRTS
jgi:MauM/NapG family ferredoxin protein